MRIIAFLLFAAFAVTGAAAQSEVPAGKARIVVYGDFTAFDLNQTEVVLDNYPPFDYKSSQKNVVYDLEPGRHALTYIYHTILGDRPTAVSLVLAAGQTAYLKYSVSSSVFELSLVKSETYQRAAGRAVISNPFKGGTL